MKWIPNKTFPHPVLSPVATPPDRDYVNREFQATLDLSPTTGEQAFRLTVTKYCLSEESLLDLIAKGKAKYATEIHCRETFERSLITSDKTENFIDFDKGRLSGWIDISSYVVCTDNVTNHFSKNFHPEFGSNASFDFTTGAVLAISIPERYFISPNPQRAMATIFQLEYSDQQDKGAFAINLEEDKIKIVMHKEDAAIFDALQHNKKAWPTLLSSVYLIAVCEALRRIQQDDTPDVKWVGVIENALNNKNIAINKNSDIVKEAQTLLNNPISNMLARGE